MGLHSVRKKMTAARVIATITTPVPHTYRMKIPTQNVNYWSERVGRDTCDLYLGEGGKLELTVG